MQERFRTKLTEKWWWVDVIAILTLLVFIALKYHNHLFGEHVFGRFQDATYMLSPAMSYCDQVMSQGDMPLWIKGMLGGMEFYNAPMISISYPFYFFGLLDYGTGFTTFQTIATVTVLHLMFLGVNSYIFGRVYKLKPGYAFLFALLLLSCAFFYKYSNWLNAIIGFTWLPLFFAGVRLLYDLKKNFLIGLLLCSVALIGMTGFVYSFFFAIYLSFVMFVFRFFTVEEKASFLIRNVALFVVAVVLSGVAIWPSFFEAENFIRWVGKGLKVVGNQALPLEAYAEALPTSSLTEFVANPDIYAYSPAHHYVGPLAFIFGLAGVYFFVKNYKEKWSLWPFVIMTVLGLLYAFDFRPLVEYVYQYLPLQNKLRHLSDNIYWFVLTICFLSAFGMQHLIAAYKSLDNNLGIKILVAVGLVASNYFLIHNIASQYALISTAIIVALMLFLVINKRKMGWALYTLMLAYTAGFFFFFKITDRQNHLIGQSSYFSADNLEAMQLLNQMQNNLPDVKQYRIRYNTTQIKDQHWSMNSIYYQLRSLQGQFAPLVHDQFKELFLMDKYDNYLRLLGVKYRVEAVREAGDGDDALIKTEKFYVDEDSLAYPHIYRANVIKPFNGGLPKFISMLQTVKDNNHVFIQDSIFREVAAALKNNAPSANVKASEIIHYNNHNLITMYVNLSHNQLYVLNEFYNDENWKIYIDGNRAPIYEVNYNQVGFVIPKGGHQIKIKYDNSLFINWYWIQRISIVILGLIFLYYLVIRKLIVRADQ